jgi:acetyl-CoA C-acetyltransferase
VVILSAARTPIGKFNGVLSSVTVTQLGITAAKAAISRAGIQPSDIEEVFMGQVISAGVGQAPARQVALGSGCPPETEATTVNKVCASGMKSVIFATQTLQLGNREVMLAGGMER